MKFRAATPFVVRPRFEERGLLVPRKLIDGQFQPFQSLQFMDGLLAPIGTGLLPFALEYVGSANLATNAASYDFGTQSFGADVASPNKRYTVVVAGTVNDGSSQISGISIGGVAGTLVVRASSSTRPCGIYLAEVSGVSGNVTVTFPDSTFKCAISIYRLVNPSSAVPDATVEDITHASGVLDLSHNIPSDGGSIAVVQALNASTWTWSGLTENHDVDIDVGDNFSSASGGSPGTPAAITATNADTTPSGLSGCAASWGP